MAKHQLHPSGMESLAKCGIAYEKRYIRGEEVAQSARAAVGTAVDRSVRANLQHKIDSHGDLLPLDWVTDIARDAIRSEWRGQFGGQGVLLTEEDREEGLSAGRAIDTSVRLATLHYNELASKLNPTRVARKWVLDVAGLDIQVAGEMDIEEGNEAIRDTKTSGKSPVKTLADESLQLSTYALAKRQLDGVLPKQVILDYLVETPKRADNKLVQLVSTRTEEHLQPVLARLEHMDKIIKSGIFTPAPIGAWWCSARYCPYHSNCRFAARPVSMPAAEPATERKVRADKGRLRGADITAQKFGTLTVIAFGGVDDHRDSKWICLCDCGTSLTVLGYNLKSGRTQSCGCGRVATLKEMATHGLTRTPTYMSWCDMIQRCTNPNRDCWKDYGGRGIRVCKQWETFANFVADMGVRPRGFTLDRINNEGNYEPGNCRWATRKEQASNRRPRNSSLAAVSSGKVTTAQGDPARVLAIRGPGEPDLADTDLIGRLQQSIEMKNGSRRIHLVK